ncbi:hypothetical protein JD844_019987 [Phrynosoma platyrhinos]|uniref:Fringe-like glycosyltransferase domain-containing protein n=1 Tax=Phrynosoma platyrhinos TaxID=52577 RepID=A0ABQ7TQM6_PHRPL|nr:hypothetical protein JD844_019987 [Phrynosoma platyrhinos]
MCKEQVGTSLSWQLGGPAWIKPELSHLSLAATHSLRSRVTFIFTDGEDEELKKRTANVINTNCSAAHSRQALSCKMAVEYDKFIESGRNGGHFMSTAEKIRLPDDCTIGYIIESVLGVKLIRSNLFHSHLENLHQVPKSEIHKQVTLSYGMFENKRNSIHMKGAFSVDEDPSRFRSVHCLLHPDTPWCPLNVVY